LEGYFDDDHNEFCQKCSNNCSTCEKVKDNCLTCRGDRITAFCVCPVGTYDDGKSEMCIKCPILCETCNENGCTSCGFNRIGPFSL
jgi:hypothetical protein